MEYKHIYRKRCPDQELDDILEDIINHGGVIIKIFEIHYGRDDWMIIYSSEAEPTAHSLE